ncbi:hypothetical protein FHU37_001771 [Allostreptomyces psammosilenae]|uniref:Uncharacterized protein n=1 Tax=Allostreptomyces psammosilenae TaxID=1892865 RepID=A0A853A2X9_9ACTN|nr:hypothetical protein [Allostreptomyces psammosilenae]
MTPMRTMFTAYLVLILGGLAYFVAVGLMQR